MSKKILCSICLEEYPQKKVSTCLNCVESGNTCHDCELKWTNAENDPIKCTICKQNTKQNISIKSLKIDNEKNEILYLNTFYKECINDPILRMISITLTILILIILFMLIYGIYWCYKNC